MYIPDHIIKIHQTHLGREKRSWRENPCNTYDSHAHLLVCAVCSFLFTAVHQKPSHKLSQIGQIITDLSLRADHTIYFEVYYILDLYGMVQLIIMLPAGSRIIICMIQQCCLRWMWHYKY